MDTEVFAEVFVLSVESLTEESLHPDNIRLVKMSADGISLKMDWNVIGNEKLGSG